MYQRHSLFLYQGQQNTVESLLHDQPFGVVTSKVEKYDDMSILPIKIIIVLDCHSSRFCGQNHWKKCGLSTEVLLYQTKNQQNNITDVMCPIHRRCLRQRFRWHNNAQLTIETMLWLINIAGYGLYPYQKYVQ